MQDDPARSGAAGASRSRPYGSATIPAMEQSLLTVAVRLGCFCPLSQEGSIVDRLEQLAALSLAIERRASALPVRPEGKGKRR